MFFLYFLRKKYQNLRGGNGVFTCSFSILYFHIIATPDPPLIGEQRSLRICYKFSKILFYFFLLFFCEFLETRSMIVPGEYFLEVGIPREIRLSWAKCEYCSRRVFSYPWEFLEFFFFLWKYSEMFTLYHLRCLQYISRSWIVSHTLIVREKCLIICIRETLKRRKTF